MCPSILVLFKSHDMCHFLAGYLFVGPSLLLSPLTVNLYTNLRDACIVRVFVVFINHNTWFSLVICSKIAQIPAYLACLFAVDFRKYLLGTRCFNYQPMPFTKFHHIKSLVLVASPNSASYSCIRHPLLLVRLSGVARWNATSWRYGHRSLTSCMRHDEQVGIPRATQTGFAFICRLTAPLLLFRPGTPLSRFVSPLWK